MKTNTKKALAIIASIALFINMDFVAPVFADTKTDDTTAVSISSNPTEATVDAVTGTEETEPAESNALPEGNDPLVIAQSDEVVAFDATAVTTDIHAVVAWVDEGDSGRPTNVVLHLQAGGTTVQTKTVTAADGWTTTFTADQFEADGTTPIIYSVAEDTVPAYKATYSIDSTTGDVTITNSLMDGNLDIGLAPARISEFASLRRATQ